MKKLVMIAGPAGVGKTAVCKELFHGIQGSAWLDGDWCWMVNPYPGKTEEQKRYAEKTMGRILDGYMQDENTNVILFCWLMQADFMFDLVTSRMAGAEYELIKVVLVCGDEEYIRRMRADNRRAEQIEQRHDMAKYRALDAHVIDTTCLTVHETAQRIRALIGMDG